MPRDEFIEDPKTRAESICPCKSRETYYDCCMPYHIGTKKPETAEHLMRSRYSAYFFRLADYLIETTHPDSRDKDLRTELARTLFEVNWRFLTIVATAKGQKEDKAGKVEFVAEYFLKGEPQELHEVSRFKRYKGVWKYLDDKG